MSEKEDSESNSYTDAFMRYLEPLVIFEYPNQHKLWSLQSRYRTSANNPSNTNSCFVTSFNGFCKLSELICSVGALWLYFCSHLCWHVEEGKFTWIICSYSLITSTSITLILYVIFIIFPGATRLKPWLKIDLAATLLCGLLAALLGISLVTTCYFHPLFTIGFGVGHQLLLLFGFISSNPLPLAGDDVQKLRGFQLARQRIYEIKNVKNVTK